MREFLNRIAVGIILALSGVALVFLTINSLVHFVYVDVEDGHLELRSHDLLTLVALVAFLVFFYLIIRFVFPKVSDTKVFVFLAVVTTALGIFLIINCVPGVHADSMMIYNYIERFNQGNYIGIEDEYYFSYNPALLGLLTYERILGSITMDIRFFYAFELLWYLLINFFSWKIARSVLEDAEEVKLVTLLSFMFLPLLFYILQVYGMLLGFALALAARYFLIEAKKASGKKSVLLVVIAAILIGGACLIKQQYQIMMIALVLLCILEFIRSPKAILIVAAVLMPIVTIGFSSAMSNAYRKASGYDMGTGEPLSLFIAMGLQEHDNPLKNGDYTGYTFDTYMEAGFDEEVASEMGKENIKNRLAYFADNPKEMREFFYYKLTGTWDEPTFASIYNGCSAAWGDTPEELFLGSLYDGDHMYNIYTKYMVVLVFLIYLGSLSNIIIKIRERHDWSVSDLLPYLYLTGGFMYYMASESAARYVYIYVYALIPALAVVGRKLWKRYI